MVELVPLGKCLKQVRGKLSTIVCYEGVWNAMPVEVLLSDLDDPLMTEWLGVDQFHKNHCNGRLSPNMQHS